MLQETETADDRAGAKASIQIFRSSEGKTLQEAGVIRYSNPQSVNDNMASLAEIGLREGFQAKCLFRAPGPDGFSLMHSWFKSNSIIPLHSHDTDCLYYVLSGSLSLGDQTLGAGDGLFVPGGAAYSFVMGPEGAQFLEFRDTADFDTNMRAAKPKFWDRMRTVIETNRETWRSETPPKDA